MSFKHRDCELGHCAYFPVEKWSGIPEPITDSNVNTISYIFNSQSEKLESLFSEIYIPVDELQGDGDTQTEYYNIGMDTDNLVENFIALYGELPLMRPYYFESKLGNIKSVAKCMSVLKAVLDTNEGKYRKLAQSLGFIYNPIENYNMVENGTDENSPTGSETLTHTVDNSQTGFVEVDGAVSTITLSPKDQGTGLFDINTLTMGASQSANYSEKNASSIEAGQRASENNPPSLTGGVAPTTNNYTTTMDNKETGRLESYQTTSGTTGQFSNTTGSQDRLTTARVKKGSETPSYTDTKTYTNKKDTLSHSLNRSGNIGITTTQQMLEQERKIVQFSLVNEFYQDLVEQLCLQVWD